MNLITFLSVLDAAARGLGFKGHHEAGVYADWR